MVVLLNEVNTFNDDKFYLSGTMIEPNSGHIIYDFGIDLNSFNELIEINRSKSSTYNRVLK